MRKSFFYLFPSIPNFITKGRPLMMSWALRDQHFVTNIYNHHLLNTWQCDGNSGVKEFNCVTSFMDDRSIQLQKRSMRQKRKWKIDLVCSTAADFVDDYEVVVQVLQQNQHCFNNNIDNEWRDRFPPLFVPKIFHAYKKTI